MHFTERFSVMESALVNGRYDSLGLVADELDLLFAFFLRTARHKIAWFHDRAGGRIGLVREVLERHLLRGALRVVAAPRGGRQVHVGTSFTQASRCSCSCCGRTAGQGYTMLVLVVAETVGLRLGQARQLQVLLQVVVSLVQVAGLRADVLARSHGDAGATHDALLVVR